MTIRVNDAALHLCQTSDWQLSNLKLQKVLYLADVNFVGKTGTRLVNEDFEAWDYGPVLPSLYQKCKAFGAKPIPNVFWDARPVGGTAEAKMLELAWSSLKSSTPGQLVEATHSKYGAWVRRYVAGAKQIKILTQDMIDEYARRTGKAA